MCIGGRRVCRPITVIDGVTAPAEDHVTVFWQSREEHCQERWHSISARDVALRGLPRDFAGDSVCAPTWLRDDGATGDGRARRRGTYWWL